MGILLILRHAVRWVLRAPGFAALAIAVLALGIGAATLMFSLVDSVLLRDLPLADPDRLVWMYNLRTERDAHRSRSQTSRTTDSELRLWPASVHLPIGLRI